MKGLLGKIRVCWDRAVQVLTKINERFWNFDEWILKSQLGVYAYFITIAVTIGVLAAWVIMGQGGACVGGWMGCAPWKRGTACYVTLSGNGPTLFAMID